jgi:hypothetical protein
MVPHHAKSIRGECSLKAPLPLSVFYKFRPTIINMQEKNSSIKTSAFSKTLRIIYLEGEKGVVSEANGGTCVVVW